MASPAMAPSKPSRAMENQLRNPCCEKAPAAINRIDAGIGIPSAPRNRINPNNGAP